MFTRHFLNPGFANAQTLAVWKSVWEECFITSLFIAAMSHFHLFCIRYCREQKLKWRSK